MYHLRQVWTQVRSSLWFVPPLLVTGAIVLVLFAVLAWGLRRAIEQGIRRSRLDEPLAVALGRLVALLVMVLGLLVAAVVVFPSFKPGDLLAALGLGSVAAGFAFKDVLQNYLAGILLLWRRPFVIGDEIRTQGFQGMVEDISVRSTWLRTYAGERAILPNSDVYTSAILVRTAFDRRRIEITVGIDYHSDLDAVRDLICAAVTGTDGVLGEPGPWVHVTDLAERSAELTVYFWVRPQQANALAVSSRAAASVAAALQRAGIDLTYTLQLAIRAAGVDGRRPER